MCEGRSPLSQRYDAWTKAVERNRHPSTEGTLLRRRLQLSDGPWFLRKRNVSQNFWILHWHFRPINCRAWRSEPTPAAVVRQFRSRNLESRDVSTRAASTVPAVVDDLATSALP